MMGRGRLDLETLTQQIDSGEIETVITAIPDLYGRLMGKRIVGRFFLEEIAQGGIHVCDYLFACDMEMEPTPGYEFSSWETGYGDFQCLPDFATLRVASWLEKSAIVICDVMDGDSGTGLSVSPRQVLKRQLERAAGLGYTVMGASELEFFAFRESYASARAKGYAGLETFGSYVEDYHILQGTQIEPLVGAIRRNLVARIRCPRR